MVRLVRQVLAVQQVHWDHCLLGFPVVPLVPVHRRDQSAPRLLVPQGHRPDRAVPRYRRLQTDQCLPDFPRGQESLRDRLALGRPRDLRLRPPLMVLMVL